MKYKSKRTNEYLSDLTEKYETTK